MTLIFAWLAALALLIGTTCLYVATPHQALFRAALPRKPLIITGCVTLAISLALLLGQMGSATAVFTWMTGLMFLWSVPPVVIRWLRYRRETAR